MDIDGTKFDNITIALAIFFLFIALTMVILIVAYMIYWRRHISNPSCSTDGNCSVNQICQVGSCIERTCSSYSDCNNEGICINSYCISLNCQSGNDCPTGFACINGECNMVGSSCQTNSDCHKLSCTNQTCIQCLFNSSCPVGQGCFDQACRYPYEGETGTNVINYVSPAQINGNITAPPGYLCNTSTCGTGINNQDPISCDNGGCPGSCPFCLNGVCRCTSGVNTESCNINSDCLSGLCRTGICVPSGGECSTNYDGLTGMGSCPLFKPYCVNGTCSATSLGAICGSTGLPPDLCSNPQSLGVPGQTGITPDGMGFFCVNGICQSSPGGLNDLCTPGSCGFIEDGIFICVSVEGNPIPQMRCINGLN